MTFGHSDICVVVLAWPHPEDLAVTLDSLMRQQRQSPPDVVVVSVGGCAISARIVDGLRNCLPLRYAISRVSVGHGMHVPRSAVAAGAEAASPHTQMSVLLAGDVADVCYADELLNKGQVLRRVWRPHQDGISLTSPVADSQGVQCRLLPRKVLLGLADPEESVPPVAVTTADCVAVSHFGCDHLCW